MNSITTEKATCLEITGNKAESAWREMFMGWLKFADTQVERFGAETLLSNDPTGGYAWASMGQQLQTLLGYDLGPNLLAAKMDEIICACYLRHGFNDEGNVQA